MGKPFYGAYFRFMRFIARRICAKYDVVGAADEAAPKVYISHHQNMYGPVMSLIWLKEPVHVWVLSPFCDKKACYQQFKEYTFSQRFAWGKARTDVCARLCARPVSRLIRSIRAIPVYRESRKVIDTIKYSVSLLQKGENILIFPDIDYQNPDPAMRDMYSGFFYLEKYYYRNTGKHLAFVPLYVSRKTKSLNVGDAVYFRDGISFADERQNVVAEIKNRVNKLALLCGDVE